MELDLRGMSCPIPALKVKDALSDNGPDKITVKVDCSTPTENIEFVADRAGYDCAVSSGGGVNVITISKRGER